MKSKMNCGKVFTVYLLDKCDSTCQWSYSKIAANLKHILMPVRAYIHYKGKREFSAGGAADRDEKCAAVFAGFAS
jgi:hypothetical protein